MDQCAQDTPQLVGCSANPNGVSVNRDTGQITHVDSTITADSQITVVTEAVSGNVNLQLMLIPDSSA